MGFDRLYGRALRLSVSSGRPGFDRLYGRVLRLALHVVGGGPLVANVGLRVGIGASGRTPKLKVACRGATGCKPRPVEAAESVRYLLLGKRPGLAGAGS